VSKSEIARTLGVRRATIIRWLKQDQYNESRGWRKGQARKYTDSKIADRICMLKRQRIEQNKYFLGSEYVQMDYARLYPNQQLPSIWFIKKAVRQAGLQTRKPKKHRKGGSQYLLYPVQSIRNLGAVQQSADFIGKKYITGHSKAINIFSTCYYAPFKLYQIKPVQAEKTVYAIDKLVQLWRAFPLPNVLRIDNGLQFRGSGSGKRSIGMFLKFLLNLNVIPLFGSPSKPWTNPHIEGHNRVFSEKVWGRNFFTDPKQVATECNRFNSESLEYYHYKYAQLVFNSNYSYIEHDQQIETDRLLSVKNKRIYFVRFVDSSEKGTTAFMNILNENIPLPEQYSHQFVFVEWDVEKEKLRIYSEFKKVVTLIMERTFNINS
jgi:hypothetical protein